MPPLLSHCFSTSQVALYQAFKVTQPKTHPNTQTPSQTRSFSIKKEDDCLSQEQQRLRGHHQEGEAVPQAPQGHPCSRHDGRRRQEPPQGTSLGWEKIFT